jgi:hypothetical protein
MAAATDKQQSTTETFALTTKAISNVDLLKHSVQKLSAAGPLAPP